MCKQTYIFTYRTSTNFTAEWKETWLPRAYTHCHLGARRVYFQFQDEYLPLTLEARETCRSWYKPTTALILGQKVCGNSNIFSYNSAVLLPILTIPAWKWVHAVVDPHTMYRVCIAQIYAPRGVLLWGRVRTKAGGGTKNMGLYSINREICWVFSFIIRGLPGWFSQSKVFCETKGTNSKDTLIVLISNNYTVKCVSYLINTCQKKTNPDKVWNCPHLSVRIKLSGWG